MVQPDVAIVNVGVSNVGSVVNMIRRIGHEPLVASSPNQLERGGRIILPGVGHFDAGMRRLRSSGMADAVVSAAGRGVPVLGICLGMQLLMEGSDEGEEPGLGLVQGRCTRLPTLVGGERFSVPHMGWNEVRFDDAVGIADPVEDWRFYFVHSYAVPASCPDAVGCTQHGIAFASAVRSGSVIGVQFHPEKSHAFGMRLLTGFLEAVATC